MKYYVYNLLGECVNVKEVMLSKSRYCKKHNQFYSTRLFTRKNAKKAIKKAWWDLPEIPDTCFIIDYTYDFKKSDTWRKKYIEKCWNYTQNANAFERVHFLNKQLTLLRNESNIVKFFVIVQRIHDYKLVTKTTKEREFMTC